MATEVNQNYFAWSQEEPSVPDISQGTTKLFGHGSISFGRFDLESLEWEKWSVFTNDKRHEEFGKFNGLVAKKKAYFEEYFQRVRELKALQQQNQQTELNLHYSGDGSDSSRTGEDEPAADHEAPTGFGTLVDDFREQKIPTTTFEHEVECHGDHENGHLVNEISASTHSSSVVGLQQTAKQVRGNVSDSTDISMQNAYSSQDDLGIAQKTTLTSKGTTAKEPLIGQASKIITNTVKMASNNVPVCTIAPKSSCSSKPERRPGGEICNMIGTIGGSGITGLRRPSAASQRPSTRERRPATRDASRKSAEVAIPFWSSTSERRSATRESANNTTPLQPSTPGKRPITKNSARKQSYITTPGRPSTADRRFITKESAPKLSNVASPRRPPTPDKRLATNESAPKQSNIVSLHRPSTGESHPTIRDMTKKHVGIATSCCPSTYKHRPVTRQGARKHADVVTLRRPFTAERGPATRDVAVKHAIVPPPCRPSTGERRPIARDVAPKHVPSCRPSTSERCPVTRDVAPNHVPSCRPSTAERCPVTKGSALKLENAVSSRCPLTPDRYLSKKSETSTPRRPSTGERHPITNDSTLKVDQKTPVKLRAVPNCSKGTMSTAVTPRNVVTPNRVKSREPENISYAEKMVEVHVDEKPKSCLSNLPPRKMLTSNVRDDRVLDNPRKPNKESPPPPPPPRRPSNIEKKPNGNILPAGGRKQKASTPRWH